jgi:hypothetical protein
MNAIELLKRQHAEVRDLFTQIEEESDEDEKLELLQELADSLAAHATIEEKIFYPAAYAGDTEDMLLEAVEEHLSMKRLIADLLEMSPDDDNFDAKIEVLKEQVEHHVEEEEGELFPAVRRELKAPELKKLGEEMELMFQEQMAGTPSAAIPMQTAQAAPLHR